MALGLLEEVPLSSIGRRSDAVADTERIASILVAPPATTTTFGTR